MLTLGLHTNTGGQRSCTARAARRTRLVQLADLIAFAAADFKRALRNRFRNAFQQATKEQVDTDASAQALWKRFETALRE